jgi:hypothetical protein
VIAKSQAVALVADCFDGCRFGYVVIPDLGSQEIAAMYQEGGRDGKELPLGEAGPFSRGSLWGAGDSLFCGIILSR